MGGKISYLPDLKKQMNALEIERRWGKDIIKEGARKTAQLRGGPRMDQGCDILSYPDSSYVYTTIIFQPSQSYICAEEITSTTSIHHQGSIIIEVGHSVESLEPLSLSGDRACEDRTEWI